MAVNVNSTEEVTDFKIKGLLSAEVVLIKVNARNTHVPPKQLEMLLERLPFVKVVYGGAKGVIDFFVLELKDDAIPDYGQIEEVVRAVIAKHHEPVGRFSTHSEHT